VVGPETLPEPTEDVRTKRIADPIEFGTDGAGLRAELRKREAAEDPIFEWKADQAMPPPGEHESFSKQIKRASEAMHTARVTAMGKQISELPSVTEELGRATAEILAKDPPIRVSPVADSGNPIEPLRDDQPVTEELSFRNMAEARRAMSNYRLAAERGQQQLLADLQATEAQQQREAQEFERLERERQAAAQRPAPQPAADPLAAEKQVLAQQAQELFWHGLSQQEREAAEEMSQLQYWSKHAPAEERGQYWSDAQARYNQLHGYMQSCAQVRTASQQNAASARQAQIDAWASAEDSKASAEIKRQMPEFSSDEQWRRLQQATRRALKESTGLTEQQIGAEWTKGRWRSAPEQAMLARLGRDQLTREGALRLNAHKRVPPVQQPGVYRPAGAGNNAGDMANLERQIANAPTVQQQLKLSTRLTQLKREAGLLRNEG
jgi:hypothetical protein